MAHNRKQTIVGINLKYLRLERRYKSHKALSIAMTANSGELVVTKDTIQRIESFKTKNPDRATINKFVKFFGIDEAEFINQDLTKTKHPFDEVSEKIAPLGIKRSVCFAKTDIQLNYDLVEKQYGVNRQWLFNMAPLMFTILAEMSLKWRMQNIEHVQKSIIDAAPDYLNLEPLANEYELQEEMDSILSKDVFANKFDIGGISSMFKSPYNPFALYLSKISASFDVEVSDSTETAVSGGEFPSYTVLQSIFDEICAHDELAELSLKEGHVKIADIPSDISQEERINFLKSKIPAERLEFKKVIDEISQSLDLDVKGGENASA